MTTFEQEIMEIKTRLTHLELLVESRQLGDIPSAPEASLPGKMSDEEVVNWLKRIGHISEPPLTARVHASRWQSLPKKEQEAIASELADLPEGPLASEIIVESRR